MPAVSVTARKEIKTDKGLVVAQKGDQGEPAAGAKPHEPGNWGKVLVHWNGKTHGYWCDPHLLKFPKGAEPADYVAVRQEYDPYALAPKLPASVEQYEYHFGHNLKVIREARHMSQAMLGRKMGEFGVDTAQSTICYREGCPESPSGQFLRAAARALDVPPFVFFIDLNDCKVYNSARKFLNGMSEELCEA